MLYFIDQIITDKLDCFYFFSSYMGKKKGTACKEYFICRDSNKMVIIFSNTFPQNNFLHA